MVHIGRQVAKPLDNVKCVRARETQQQYSNSVQF
jgi:hypothetical protein